MLVFNNEMAELQEFVSVWSDEGDRMLVELNVRCQEEWQVKRFTLVVQELFLDAELLPERVI